MGLMAGGVSFFACTKLKSWFHYDDALDTFGVHAVGGTLGAFLTGIFATASVNPNLSANPASQNGLAGIVGHMLWLEQLKVLGGPIALALGVPGLIVALVTPSIRVTLPTHVHTPTPPLT